MSAFGNGLQNNCGINNGFVYSSLISSMKRVSCTSNKWKPYCTSPQGFYIGNAVIWFVALSQKTGVHCIKAGAWSIITDVKFYIEMYNISSNPSIITCKYVG